MENSFKLDFVGVGAGHSGTTWLFECLCEHPQVVGSKPKETKFFKENFEQDSSYLASNFFPQYNPALTYGEFTPSYFYSEPVAKRIYDMFPDTKIIVCLRHPYEYIRSAYYFNKQRNLVDFKDLNEQIKTDIKNNDSAGHALIKHASYGEQLAPYFALFPKEQIKVVFYDDIVGQPDQVIVDLFAFLGVDNTFKPSNLNSRINLTASNKRYFAILPKLYTNTSKYLRQSTLGRMGIKLARLTGLKKLLIFILKCNIKQKNLKPLPKQALTKEVKDAIKEMLADDQHKLKTLLGDLTIPWQW